MEQLLTAMRDHKFQLARDLEEDGKEPGMVQNLRTEGYLINTILWLMQDEKAFRNFCEIYEVTE